MPINGNPTPRQGAHTPDCLDYEDAAREALRDAARLWQLAHPAQRSRLIAAATGGFVDAALQAFAQALGR